MSVVAHSSASQVRAVALPSRHPRARRLDLMTDAAPPIFVGWPATLARLFAREDLTSAEAGAALGEILLGRAEASQIGAFLAALRTR